MSYGNCSSSIRTNSGTRRVGRIVASKPKPPLKAVSVLSVLPVPSVLWEADGRKQRCGCVYVWMRCGGMWTDGSVCRDGLRWRWESLGHQVDPVRRSYSAVPHTQPPPPALIRHSLGRLGGAAGEAIN